MFTPDLDSLFIDVSKGVLYDNKNEIERTSKFFLKGIKKSQQWGGIKPTPEIY